jgi:hypothetical protein
VSGRRLLAVASAAACLALAGAASADVLLLRNADLVPGRIDLAEFSVATPTGVVRLTPADVIAIDLGRIGGDFVYLRRGGTLVGRLEAPAIVVRLGSGQDLPVPRGAIDQLRFQPR